MSQAQKSEIKGLVDNITYQNPDNGYTVCTVDCDGEPVTVVGNIPMLGEGEFICAKGSFTNHPTYGRQFVVEEYQKELPATSESILAYLSSGVIKGIGPVTAKRIVDKYGEETLKVMEEHPEWLSDIKGVTAKRLDSISKSFRDQYGMRQIMLYFQGMLSPAMSIKVYKQWGNAAIDILRTNPYLLCEEIDGIGFERADQMALKMGFLPDSEDRLASGVKYVLSLELNRNGNCCVPLSSLTQKSASALGCDVHTVESVVGILSQNGEVVAVKNKEGEILVYLENVYRTEKYVAEKLVLLDDAVSSIPVDDADKEIQRVEKEKGLEFAPLQKVAINSAVSNGVVVVTGGPGTGKTTVIRAIIALFERIGMSVCLAAPTGRAAKRMTAATGYEAKTVHRLLECEFGGEERIEFRRNEDNFLDEEVVIIDEASMVDMFLFCALLRAIRPGSRLILIGDADQLAPVGAGEVFSDIIKSGAFMSVRLCDIFRQAQDSRIVTNAHLINEGRMPYLDNKGDFFYLKRNNANEVRELVRDLCCRRLPEAYGYDKLRDIQIICPTRKGDAGTVSVNALMQGVLNPASTAKVEREVKDVIFREGDKVMMVKNNYDIEWTDETGRNGSGVFNGDIGFITEIDRSEESFTIEFDDGRSAVFDYSCFDDIEHAYAITVHKSQGSEYSAVVIPLYGVPAGLLSKNMLYTALTRAGKLAVLVGRIDVMRDMVENNRRAVRYTGLLRFLEKKQKKLAESLRQRQLEDGKANGNGE